MLECASFCAPPIRTVGSKHLQFNDDITKRLRNLFRKAITSMARVAHQDVLRAVNPRSPR